jgi:hypothetical protein
VFPRDMVYLRNISVDTLHKGDTEDNADNNNNNFYVLYIIITSITYLKLKDCGGLW